MLYQFDYSVQREKDVIEDTVIIEAENENSAWEQFHYLAAYVPASEKLVFVRAQYLQ